MQIKSPLAKIMLMLAIVLMAFFSACSDAESDSVVFVKPNNSFYYLLYPNDGAISDSVASNISHGVLMPLHPNGVYTLSFEGDSLYGPPQLQLFRYYLMPDSVHVGFNNVRVLEPEIRDGRYYYRFSFDEKNAANWATTLVQDDSFYKGRVRNVSLEGDGPYSDSLSINLIAVGKIHRTKDSLDVEELAQKMLSYFRKYYTSIKIDTVHVRYAHEHPTLGHKYPADEPWLAGKSSEDEMLSELGGWPDQKNNLDIVYMHRIEMTSVMGYSALFSGNLGGGGGSTVIIGNHVKTEDGEDLSSSEEILQSALHEVGHFFGLRHTTATISDMNADGDYSVLEDGFDDTPYCAKLQQFGLLKKEGGVYGFDAPADYYHRRLSKPVSASTVEISVSIEKCPDASNYMFPAILKTPFDGFSRQQLSVIRRNLTLFPH